MVGNMRHTLAVHRQTVVVERAAGSYQLGETKVEAAHRGIYVADFAYGFIQVSDANAMIGKGDAVKAAHDARVLQARFLPGSAIKKSVIQIVINVVRENDVWPLLSIQQQANLAAHHNILFHRFFLPGHPIPVGINKVAGPPLPTGVSHVGPIVGVQHQIAELANKAATVQKLPLPVHGFRRWAKINGRIHKHVVHIVGIAKKPHKVGSARGKKGLLASVVQRGLNGGVVALPPFAGDGSQAGAVGRRVIHVHIAGKVVGQIDNVGGAGMVGNVTAVPRNGGQVRRIVRLRAAKRHRNAPHRRAARLIKYAVAVAVPIVAENIVEAVGGGAD